MRTRTTLALGALLTVLAAGCGQSPGQDPGVATAQSAGVTPSASASASDDSGNGQDDQLKFSQCMREHGMTWFPDPSNGGLRVKVPSSVKKEDFDAAQKACREFSPGGEDGPKITAAELEQMRQMSQCMRDNGITNFPDPRPDGGIHIDQKLGIDPESPTFQAAQKKCEKLMPRRGEDTKEETGTGTSSGGGA
ncbi:hypothetical protein [Actinoplanes palleronii]|uniref:Lipoprotein n=1 Tax=Actinoplanes palleronii TaxID=113570 RepID=A0ABQ4B6Z6_9ACTN|nr:hypothetical protein [Actinoplanes palleronii]GIE66437.1 hypothetical protein Apa02nite_025450 [Actinoplanes palleronii]